MWFNRKFFIILTLLRHSVLLPFSFLVFLFLPLIIPETSRLQKITDFSLPPNPQPKHLPYVLVKPRDQDYRPNSKTPIEILKSSQDLSKIQEMQFTGNLDRSYFDKKKFKHINDCLLYTSDAADE